MCVCGSFSNTAKNLIKLDCHSPFIGLIFKVLDAKIVFPLSTDKEQSHGFPVSDEQN